MSENTTSMPHDAIFKQFLQDPATARDFLQIHLPGSLQRLCDLDTLKLESGSFIEESLQASYSDMLYSLKTAAGDGYIYALIEHQSKPDRHMGFRLMRYAIAAMQRHLNAGHRQLPLVIPILFYHGLVSPYPHSLNWTDEFAAPEMARAFYSQPFPLADITVIPDSEIMHHRRIASLELLQKHIRLRDLAELIAPLAQLLVMGYTDRDRLIAILNYMLLNGTADQPEKLIQELAQRTAHHEGTLMTVAEYLEQKGWKKGLEKGMEKGLAEGRNEAATRIAKALLQDGMERQRVIALTGVLADDLNAIAQEKAE